MCRGYVYTKKTNLLTAGKKSCLFRCGNRTSSFVCSSSISLKTDVLNNVNSICEPFHVVNSNISHHISCTKFTEEEIEQKNM